MIEELENKLTRLREEYHNKAADLTASQAAGYTAAIKGAMADVQAAYVAGCQSLHRQMPFGVRKVDGWQIGNDKRSFKAVSREEAVKLWNEYVESLTAGNA